VQGAGDNAALAAQVHYTAPTLACQPPWTQLVACHECNPPRLLIFPGFQPFGGGAPGNHHQPYFSGAPSVASGAGAGAGAGGAQGFGMGGQAPFGMPQQNPYGSSGGAYGAGAMSGAAFGGLGMGSGGGGGGYSAVAGGSGGGFGAAGGAPSFGIPFNDANGPKPPDPMLRCVRTCTDPHGPPIAQPRGGCLEAVCKASWTRQVVCFDAGVCVCVCLRVRVRACACVPACPYVCTCR